MQKFLLAALVAAALVVPSAGAQDTNHTVTVEINELPASAETNQTTMTIPFEVHATVAGAPPCASQSAAYTIEITATVTNSSGNHTSANVNPRQVTIAGPVLLPAVPGASGERTVPATLIVNAGPYSGDMLNATVRIEASFTGGTGGCPGVTAAPASSDTADFQANFEPVRGFGSTETRGNEMPGPAFAVVLLGLVALAMVVRRFN